MGCREIKRARQAGWGGRIALCAGLVFAPLPALPQEAAEARGESAPALGETSERPCGKSDFETVVEDAAGTLRDMNNSNKPAFQDKLRQLKDKRGWTHDQFLREAAPFVRDEKISRFDQHTEELLGAIATMGQAGASANKPDCSLMLELRSRMAVLVATQTARWGYMFSKIDAELGK